nr:uncharacterized protein LOC116773606 [Danaus plexippus plexippus]
MDSFHECLQEYGEGLEVVQICLEPEDESAKYEDLSALADVSYDDCKKDTIRDDDFITEVKDNKQVNGVMEFKSSKSDGSLDDPDDDMTITEDDTLHTPRELTMRSKSEDRKDKDRGRGLSKQQSKDLSTSDEMVFAVTPTGLERISFEKYWKDVDVSKSKTQNDDSWKECPNSPSDDTSFYDATMRISVQEQNNSLLYIDHEIDGYETCVDDDSSSVKCPDNSSYKINGESEIKELDKHDKIHFNNKDNDVCAKTEDDQITANAVDDVSSYSHPYIEEHIIKQMKSLRIEPLSIHINNKKIKKKSPSKPSKSERRVIEYYNDQAECLKEIRQKKLEEEEKKYREEHQISECYKIAEKKMHLKKQLPSEESTDVEPYVSGCHKCFLENYAYEITKAYIKEASTCKYCEVIRDMLEGPKVMPNRRMSAPALFNLESIDTDTDDEDLLAVPVVKDRRKSTGPLKFPVAGRRSR